MRAATLLALGTLALAATVGDAAADNRIGGNAGPRSEEVRRPAGSLVLATGRAPAAPTGADADIEAAARHKAEAAADAELGAAARRKAEARQGAWDRKMKAVSGSICTGC